jgi:hypothetical protein
MPPLVLSPTAISPLAQVRDLRPLKSTRTGFAVFLYIFLLAQKNTPAVLRDREKKGRPRLMYSPPGGVALTNTCSLVASALIIHRIFYNSNDMNAG